MLLGIIMSVLLAPEKDIVRNLLLLLLVILPLPVQAAFPPDGDQRLIQRLGLADLLQVGTHLNSHHRH